MYMKNFLNSDWLRTMQSENTIQRKETLISNELLFFGTESSFFGTVLLFSCIHLIRNSKVFRILGKTRTGEF